MLLSPVAASAVVIFALGGWRLQVLELNSNSPIRGRPNSAVCKDLSDRMFRKKAGAGMDKTSKKGAAIVKPYYAKHSCGSPALLGV